MITADLRVSIHPPTAGQQKKKEKKRKRKEKEETDFLRPVSIHAFK